MTNLEYLSLMREKKRLQETVEFMENLEIKDNEFKFKPCKSIVCNTCKFAIFTNGVAVECMREYLCSDYDPSPYGNIDKEEHDLNCLKYEVSRNLRKGRG